VDHGVAIPLVLGTRPASQCRGMSRRRHQGVD
jgi:hypothetical protein